MSGKDIDFHLPAMEEWQRRLKAEKEVERQKKLESAEILQGYRGGVKEEDLKLKALRDEERKLQQDAYDNLHSYQAKEVQTIPKERQQRDQQAAYPTPVNVGNGVASDPLEGIVMGSVSERAAVFGTLESTKEEQIKASIQQESRPNESAATYSLMGEPLPADEPYSSFSDEMLSQLPPSDKAPLESVDGTINEKYTSSNGLKEAHDTFTPASMQEQPMKGNTSTPIVKDHTPVEMAPSSGLPESRSEVSEVNKDPISEEIIESTTKMATNETSKQIRVDVLFSFGLVTVLQEPELFPYMNAVHALVSKALEKSATNERITIDVKHRPFVKGKVRDDSYVSRSNRKEVKRIVVTAAVPINIQDISFKKTAKEIVVGALQAAVESGDFLSLAQK